MSSPQKKTKPTFNPESLFSPTRVYLAQADNREMIIDEVIPGACLTMLASPPGSGKTRISLAICRAVATGSDFLGFDCDQGKVLYLNLDMMHQADIKDRFLELNNSTNLPAWVDNIVWYDDQFNLLGPITDPDTGQNIPDPNTSLMIWWKQWLHDYIIKHKFKLVIIDTFHKLMVNSELDHTNNDDADRVLLPLKDMARKTKAGILLLHHTPLDDEKRPRGASAISATCDHLLYTEGSIKSKLTLGIVKTRLSESGKFPLTISDNGFTWRHVEDTTAHNPMGAWVGLIEQQQILITEAMQKTLDKAKFFTDYMESTAMDFSDGVKMVRHNSLKTLLGSETMIQNVRKHLKDQGVLKYERKSAANDSNPHYFLKVDGSTWT